MNILYVTGNSGKYQNAKNFFLKFNISVDQAQLELDEIQSDDYTEIAIKKAQIAFSKVNAPLFVNDASWSIPALNGFPGPFMKYINKWFEPVDFINLMQTKSDRTILLRDIIVYVDENGYKVFTHEHAGEILSTVANFEYKHSTDVVISLSGNHRSIAEEKMLGTLFVGGEDKIWNEFANWLQLR